MRVLRKVDLSELPAAIITRASRAVYMERSGLFRYAEIDELRVGYDYYNNDNYIDNLTFFRGAVIEPERTNYVRNTTTSDVNIATTLLPTNMTGTASTASFTNAGFALSFYGSGSVRIVQGDLDVTVNGSDMVGRSFDAFYLASGTASLTFQGNVYGVQLERSSVGFIQPVTPSAQLQMTRQQRLDAFGHPTSWIPTNASAVTRAADVVTQSGIAASTFTAEYLDFDPSELGYSLGDRVEYEGDVYQCLGDIPSGKYPNRNAYPYGSETDDYWIYVKASNTRGYYDGLTSSTSSGTDEQHVSIVLAEVDIDTLCAIGAKADVVEVCLQAYGSGGTLLDVTSNKNSALTNSSKTVYQRTETNDVIYTGSYGTVASFRIVSALDDATNDPINSAINVSISEFVLGESVYAGSAELGAGSKLLDKSIESENSFGTVVYQNRGFRKEIQATVWIDRNQQNMIFNLMSGLFGVSTLWVISELEQDAEALIALGTFSDFSHVTNLPTKAQYTIKIRSLIL